MMVPMQVTIVPVFMLIRGMGLSDTLLALILPALPTAFGTFLMRQYFIEPAARAGRGGRDRRRQPVPDVLLGLRAAGPARSGDRRHPRLQLPLERVLPAADPDHQRGELHPAARAGLAAGQPRHRQRRHRAGRRGPVDDPRARRLRRRAADAARGPDRGHEQVTADLRTRLPGPARPSRPRVGQRPERLLVRRRALPRVLPVQPGRAGPRRRSSGGTSAPPTWCTGGTEPIALVNRPGELDEYGCWTGCVVDDDGMPTAVYSAVADATRRAEVLLARSDRDMRIWQQGRKSVAGMPDDPAVTDVRDPFVFTVDGHRYAVQGAGSPPGQRPDPRLRLRRPDLLDRRSGRCSPATTRSPPTIASGERLGVPQPGAASATAGC